MKTTWIQGLAVVVAVVVGLAGSPGISHADDPPLPAEPSPATIQCKDATETTITLSVCAGSAGAPSGFLLEWMPPPPGFIPPGTLPADRCFAGFFPIASDPEYALAPGQCTEITVAVPSKPEDLGEKWEAGCVGDLQCSTSYSFIAQTTGISTHPQPVLCSTKSCEVTGHQGCTPGYWKNHLASWNGTGYTTNQLVGSVFSGACASVAGATLQQALSFKGGSTICAAQQILLRAAVAALLNAGNGGVAYPRTSDQIISDVNSALASNTRDTILALAAELDADNNLGCPLN